MRQGAGFLVGRGCKWGGRIMIPSARTPTGKANRMKAVIRIEKRCFIQTSGERNQLPMLRRE